MKTKLLSFLATFLVLGLMLVNSVSAHVVVSPNEVKTASRIDFAVGVPNEKDIPTTQVRLVMPEGLESVTPYVKPGWTIEMKKEGTGEEAKVTEITWKDGSVDAGLRDSFTFRAMTSSNESTIQWKAYQTYADGTVVSWDQTPTDSEEESETSGPYSETKVVEELSSQTSQTKTSYFEKNASIIAYVALALGAVAVVFSMRKR